MSALARIKAALRRLSPSWPSTEPDTSVGKEIDSIAASYTPVADLLDEVIEELFPDGTTKLVARWEKIARQLARPGDTIDMRRERIQAVLRRLSGPRLDQLAKMLSGPFDLSVDDIIFVEPLRSMIEDGMTQTNVSTWALSASPTLIKMGLPWPGVIDDFGVRLYIATDNPLDQPTIVVRSPNGTTWTILFVANGWYVADTLFVGERAGGHWSLTATTAGGPTSITELRLLVSNDVDSAQIYNFFALRDASLPGTPDIATSQRLFAHTALGHNNAQVIERAAFIVGDPHSLCGREPVGV